MHEKQLAFPGKQEKLNVADQQVFADKQLHSAVQNNVTQPLDTSEIWEKDISFVEIWEKEKELRSSDHICADSGMLSVKSYTRYCLNKSFVEGNRTIEDKPYFGCIT